MRPHEAPRGENFWKDAEDAIRSRTIKFIYVLSRTSNEKEGPRNELQIAKNVVRKDKALHDFIIPLHVDDLPHGEINVLLTSINAIPFEKSWAKGYSQLLEVLEREKVSEESELQSRCCPVMVERTVQCRTRGKARAGDLPIELLAGEIDPAFRLAAHAGEIRPPDQFSLRIG